MPAGLQGKSLRPLLDNATGSWDKPAVSQTSRNPPSAGPGVARITGYSLRTERYRYTQWVQAGDDAALGEELYDDQTDPREVGNLTGDPSSVRLKARLRQQLADIRRARPIVAAATGGAGRDRERPGRPEPVVFFRR